MRIFKLSSGTPLPMMISRPGHKFETLHSMDTTHGQVLA